MAVLIIAANLVSTSRASCRDQDEQTSNTNRQRDETESETVQATAPAESNRSHAGPKHALLAPLVGTWKSEYFPSGRGDGKTPSSTAKQINTWVHNGRFLRLEFQSRRHTGADYLAVSYWGYDYGDKRYEMVSLDDIGTAMAFSTGDASPDGKSFTMYERSDIAANDTFRTGIKEIIAIVDRNHYVVTSYEVKEDGTERERFIMRYSRIT